MRQLLAMSLAISISTLVVVAQAIQVVAIKENKTLLKLDGASVKTGDRFVARDNTGKKRALVEILQVRGDRAVAFIRKGNMLADPKTYSLQTYSDAAAAVTPPAPVTAPPAEPDPAPAIAKVPPLSPEATPEPPAEVAPGPTPVPVVESPPPPPRVPKKIRRVPQNYGYLLGLSQSSMQVKLSDAASVQMAGSSFNLEAFYERLLDGPYSAMGRVGYDNLKVQGSTDATFCAGSNTCSVDIGYLAADALVRYNVRGKRIHWWAGGGMGFLFAMSKSSNVIDTSKISTNQKILLALGIDYRLSSRSFLPFQFDYAIYPNNNTVTTNQMTLRVGYGIRF